MTGLSTSPLVEHLIIGEYGIMRNIEKANKALERISVYAFLEGRRCSFINGYYERYKESDITISISHGFDADKVEIVGTLSCNGWNDKAIISVTNKTTLKSLTIQIIEMLVNFRHVVG